jgi:hypothetical protein
MPSAPSPSLHNPATPTQTTPLREKRTRGRAPARRIGVTRLHRTEDADYAAPRCCRAHPLDRLALTRDGLLPLQVKQATRKVADEVLKDSAVAVREVEKALLDYEQPMKGFPGGLLGI